MERTNGTQGPNIRWQFVNRKGKDARVCAETGVRMPYELHIKVDAPEDLGEGGVLQGFEGYYEFSQHRAWELEKLLPLVELAATPRSPEELAMIMHAIGAVMAGEDLDA